MAITQRKSLQFGDERVKFLTEMLNGIRIVKYYAWEMPLKQKLTEIRENELNEMKSVYNMRGFMLAIQGYVMSY